MEVAGILGEILDGAGKMAVLAVVQANGANVLVAAPDEFGFLLPAAFNQHAGESGKGGNQHGRGHEDYEQQDRSRVAAPAGPANPERTCGTDRTGSAVEQRPIGLG